MSIARFRFVRRWRRRVAHFVLPLVSLVAVHAGAQAAPPGARPEPVATTLALVSVPELAGGKLAAMKGTAAGDGDYFVIDGLSILQPVTVTLLAKDPTADLELRVFKGDWDLPLRTAATLGAGFAQTLFRTHWDFRIQVRPGPAGRASDYQLLVWVADEIVPELAPVIVPMKAARGAKEVK